MSITDNDSSSVAKNMFLFEVSHLSTIKSMMTTDEFSELVSQFRPVSQDALCRLQKALSEGNLDRVQRVSHEAKGMFGNFGAIKIVEIAKALQSSRNIDDAKRLSLVFEVVLNETVDAIEKELQNQ